jgi:Flp pilus assembly protein TadB
MTKKPIDRLYGLPFGLILLLGLAKYLNLFPIPAWLFGLILVWGAIAVVVEAIRQRKNSH